MISFKYLKSKKVSFILVLVFVLGLLFSGAYFLPRVLQKSTPDSPTSDQSPSVFEKLSQKNFDAATNTLYEVYANSEEYKANFNWETSLARAKVLEIASEEQQVLLSMTYPENTEVYPNGRHRVTLDCEPSKTYAMLPTNPHMNVYKSDFVIFDSLEVGDVLNAQCSDKDCFRMGPFCAFIDVNASN